MTTSGTTTFNLDIVELIEEAYELCGMESRSGYDMRTARRSLNLLMVDWANRGINLWTVEGRSQLLTSGTGTYTLGADIVDLIEHMISIPNSSTETRYNLTRVSVSTFATRTNPAVSSRPTQIYVNRLQPAPIVSLWPIPDDAYTMYYWVLRRIQDAGAYTNNLDVPFRFLPALVSGLAYQLGRKVLSSSPGDTRYNVMFLEQRIMRLEKDYETALNNAMDEDRERASLHIVPRMSR